MLAVVMLDVGRDALDEDEDRIEYILPMTGLTHS